MIDKSNKTEGKVGKTTTTGSALSRDAASSDGGEGDHRVNRKPRGRPPKIRIPQRTDARQGHSTLHSPPLERPNIGKPWQPNPQPCNFTTRAFPFPFPSCRALRGFCPFFSSRLHRVLPLSAPPSRTRPAMPAPHHPLHWIPLPVFSTW